MSAYQSLRKLSLVLLTQYKKSEISDHLNDPNSPIYSDFGLFEAVAAVHASDRYQCEMILWKDLEPSKKALLGLPVMDIGIDYVSENLRILGQAKCHKSLKVSSAEMNRTLHCALIAQNLHKESKFVEFSTTEVSLSRTRYPYQIVNVSKQEDLNTLPFDELVPYSHTVITKQVFRNIIERAMRNVGAIMRELASEIRQPSGPLRYYQNDAIKAIKSTGITRVNFACRTGKTRVGLEHTYNQSRAVEGQYIVCVFVPFIELMEQWCVEIGEDAILHPDLDICVVPLGTGYPDPPVDVPKNKTVFYVVVNNSVDKVEHILFNNHIVDEAHIIDKKVYEKKDKKYLNKVKALTQNKAIYLSATFPKHVANEIDPACIYTMEQAIKDEFVNDYEICVPIIGGKSTDSKSLKWHGIIKYLKDRVDMLSVLVYFNRTADAKEFANLCRKNGIQAESIDGRDRKDHRKNILNKFKTRKIRVLASVNTIGLGITLPVNDAVIFMDPIHSEVGIIQRSCRCLGKHPDKRISHIVLPILENDFEDGRVQLMEIIQKLSKYDKRFIDNVNCRSSSRLSVSYVDAESDPIKLDEIEESEIKITELIFRDINSLWLDSWKYKFDLVITFRENDFNNKYPTADMIIDGIRIGQWWKKQKELARNGSLSPEHLKMIRNYDLDLDLSPMEKMECTYCGRSNISTQGGLDHHKCTKHNLLWNVRCIEYMTTKKPYWIKKQQTFYKHGHTITPIQVQILDKIEPGWRTGLNDQNDLSTTYPGYETPASELLVLLNN
jgi:superfamily II DNA or RNA helicase